MRRSARISETARRPAGSISNARIIVISQFFGPNQSAVGQFLADFANGAALAGHDVHVICGRNQYASEDASTPLGPWLHGSEGASGGEEFRGHGSVRVTRVRTATFSQSKVQKLISYAIFFIGAVWEALRISKPGVVVTLTAPPGLAWIGWLLQRIRGCRFVTWEMDLYPDIAIALDIPVARWTAPMLDFPRRRANTVIAPGACMKRRLIHHAIPEDRIVVAENWADGQTILPMPFPGSTPLRILYSGNLGLAHDVRTIRAVMERLSDRPDILFDFAGGGLERKALIDFCERLQLKNAAFRSYVPLHDLGASLAQCHVGLVTQKAATLGAVVPSKIYGIMAAGRPILYIGPAEATPRLLIREFDCGWHFECGDAEGVSALLLHLFENPEELRWKGWNGRKAFDDSFEKAAGVARIMKAAGLETLTNGRTARQPLSTELFPEQIAR